MIEINTVTDALEAVASLIREPSRWTLDAEARYETGARVEPTNPAAVAWSIGGAITRALDPEAEDITDAEWMRRTNLEMETYRTLGITTDRADGDLPDHLSTMRVLRDARDRLAA